MYIDRYDGAGRRQPLRASSSDGPSFAWEMLDVNIVLSRQLTPESKRALPPQHPRPRPRLSRRSSNSTTTRTWWWTTGGCTGCRTPSPRPTACRTRAASTAARVGGNGRLRQVSKDPFNYVRNSCEGGHRRLRRFDGRSTRSRRAGPDPILQVYRNIFPEPVHAHRGDVRRASASTSAIPEELLRAQADAFLQYHMTDVKEFFLKEDEWQLAQEVVGVGRHRRPG